MILVTGSGSLAGSYPIRAMQLGAAIGATVIPKATSAKGYKVAVLVKRALHDTISAIHRDGAKLVYDVVDAWPQPAGNEWGREECLAWLRTTMRVVKPKAIVAATRAMAADCESFGVPVLALPHHARPGVERNPIRETVQTVGYEGSPRHLGSWQPWLEKECARRGWRFVLNPERLADVDIVVALRERTGYAAMAWKSNVKLANAQASGTPFIGARERGYLETSVGPERLVETERDVSRAFDALTPHAERARAAGWMYPATPRLEAVAATYRAWLESLNA